jgi:enoyl-CoA hydratase/carnithine racemase
VREAACALAADLAVSAPLAVVSTRQTLRAGLADAVAAATRHEAAEQRVMFRSQDFAEGVAAMNERRPPVFHGR